MIFNANTDTQRKAVADYVRKNINAPYVSVVVATLGGVARAAVMIKVSLDEKRKWPNAILHNSRYFMMSLERDGELEQFSSHYKLPKKFRKAKVKSLGDAVVKINKYISQIK